MCAMTSYDTSLTAFLPSRAVCSVRAFARDESGAVATDWAFMTASAMGVTIALISSLNPVTGDVTLGLVTQLTETDFSFRSRNFGQDRQTVLLNETFEDFNNTQVAQRYERFSDPNQRTDAQVRNAHRNWSRRTADPTYQNPGRARDMVTILDMAMDARGIEPHDDI